MLHPRIALPSAFAWTDHACRSCGSRLAVSASPNAAEVFHCGTCLATAGTVEGICGCGVPMGNGPRFRCELNPAPNPTNPAIVVIAFGAAEP